MVKGTLEIWIKLIILSWGDYPGLYRQAHYNHEGPDKREAGHEKGRRCAAGSEDGRGDREHGMWVTSDSWPWKEMDSPLELPKGGNPADSLMSAQ